MFISNKYFSLKDKLNLKAQISMARTNMATEIIKGVNILYLVQKQVTH